MRGGGIRRMSVWMRRRRRGVGPPGGDSAGLERGWEGGEGGLGMECLQYMYDG